MITQLVVYWILLIFKKSYKLIAADLSKQKQLDADSRAIQQISFTAEISQAAVSYYKSQKKQHYNFLKEQQKFCNYI